MRANVNASRLAGVVLSAMVASLSGCASFERHRLSDVSLPTGHPNGKGPVLTYAFSSGMRGQGIGETEHPKRIQRLMEKEFIDALTQSGYSVNTDRGVEGDISLNTRLTNHGNWGGGDAVRCGVGRGNPDYHSMLGHRRVRTQSNSRVCWLRAEGVCVGRCHDDSHLAAAYRRVSV